MSTPPIIDIFKLKGEGKTGAITVESGVVKNVIPGAAGNVLTSDGTKFVSSPSSGGTVTTVTASGPLASSGGATPNISLTGVVAVANGGTNSSAALNNNRIMESVGGAIVEAAAITANRALASNASGLPVASATTDAELGFVSGVTSAIQTQINAKGSGTVTSVSVVSANGLAGTVATATTTPAITLSTTVTGILQGNGTAISAATTTGSGSVVLATSPTLVTPNLDTPSVLTLTNATGLPLTTGVTGTLPIANGGTGQVTANAALNALLPSQAAQAGNFLQTNGTDTAWISGGLFGTMPSAHQSSTTVVTSATTTYVTAISTTITTTAASAKVYAHATAAFTVTGAVPTVLKYRVSINGVAGQEQLLSLTAVTTNYTAAVQYISAALAAGTYTVLFEIARNSGTGTVSFFEGTLDAVGLQGAESNGITSITGLGLTVGPGSGAQALTGVLSLAGGGTNVNNTAVNGGIAYGTATGITLSAAGAVGDLLRSGGAGPPTWTAEIFPASTTINQLLYSSANNVVSGLATVNTAALVTSSTGVPSWTSGATANRVLRTNGTTVSFSQVAAATDISGTLPVANGGTGLTAAFAAGRVMFSNGTTLAADALFTYTTANTRFFVGAGGGTGRINGTVSTTDPTPNDLAGNFFSRATANSAVNIQNENTLATLDLTNSGGTTVGANILAEASRGTLPARTQSVAGDTLFSINAHGRTASAWSTGFAANISIVTTDTVTDTTNGGEIVFSTTPNSGAAPVERLRIRQSGETNLVNSHLKSTQTTAPTIAVGANAGTGASASLAKATDVAGEITINTGTIGISTGSYATITFNKAYLVAPIVVLTPANGTISTSVYVTATTTTFDINFALAGGISSTYVLNYHVIETQ